MKSKDPDYFNFKTLSNEKNELDIIRGKHKSIKKVERPDRRYSDTILNNDLDKSGYKNIMHEKNGINKASDIPQNLEKIEIEENPFHIKIKYNNMDIILKDNILNNQVIPRRSHMINSIDSNNLNSDNIDLNTSIKAEKNHSFIQNINKIPEIYKEKSKEYNTNILNLENTNSDKIITSPTINSSFNNNSFTNTQFLRQKKLDSKIEQLIDRKRRYSNMNQAKQNNLILPESYSNENNIKSNQPKPAISLKKAQSLLIPDKILIAIGKYNKLEKEDLEKKFNLSNIYLMKPSGGTVPGFIIRNRENNFKVEEFEPKKRKKSQLNNSLNYDNNYNRRHNLKFKSKDRIDEYSNYDNVSNSSNEKVKMKEAANIAIPSKELRTSDHFIFPQIKYSNNSNMDPQIYEKKIRPEFFSSADQEKEVMLSNKILLRNKQANHINSSLDFKSNQNSINNHTKEYLSKFSSNEFHNNNFQSNRSIPYSINYKPFNPEIYQKTGNQEILHKMVELNKGNKIQVEKSTNNVNAKDISNMSVPTEIPQNMMSNENAINQHRTDLRHNIIKPNDREIDEINSNPQFRIGLSNISRNPSLPENNLAIKRHDIIVNFCFTFYKFDFNTFNFHKFENKLDNYKKSNYSNDGIVFQNKLSKPKFIHLSILNDFFANGKFIIKQDPFLFLANETLEFILENQFIISLILLICVLFKLLQILKLILCLLLISL